MDQNRGVIIARSIASVEKSAYDCGQSHFFIDIGGINIIESAKQEFFDERRGCYTIQNTFDQKNE